MLAEYGRPIAVALAVIGVLTLVARRSPVDSRRLSTVGLDSIDGTDGMTRRRVDSLGYLIGRLLSLVFVERPESLVMDTISDAS